MLNSIDKQMQFKALRREPNMSWTIYSYIYIRPSVPVVKQNMTSLGKSTLLWIWSEKNYLEKSLEFRKESWLWHMLVLGTRFIYMYIEKNIYMHCHETSLHIFAVVLHNISRISNLRWKMHTGFYWPFFRIHK